MNPNPTAAHPPRSPEPGARNEYVDTLRGAAIFGVACIHFGGSFATSENAWSPSFRVGLALNQVFSFAVPLFVFLAGVLAGGPSRRAPVSIWTYYGRRLARIGLPYLAASAASFFLLGQQAVWSALPGFSEQLQWLAGRLFFSGIEPTLYFIPLILQLYLLQPALLALPEWIGRLTGGRFSRAGVVGALSVLFLAIHVALAILCYRNVLNYYNWGRPFVLFWVFYFFAGLHFRTLGELLPRPRWSRVAAGALVLAVAAMAYNALNLTNRAVVGARFEFSKVDYAYVRPEILVYNLAVVAGLAAGLALGWRWRSGILALLGRYSLEIYLWHILVLYEIAWRHGQAMADCRQVPELILIICFSACLGIAAIALGWSRFLPFVRQYRITIVKVR